MSDGDSFIQEVTEEVRRDRMFGLWRRYGPFVIAGVIVLVAVAAWLAWRDYAREEDAREAGALLIEAAQAGSPERRAENFLAAADAADTGARLVARLRAAGELVAAGSPDEAQTLYNEIAIDPEAPRTFAGLAAYRAAVLQAATGDVQGAIASLGPLTASEEPFRLLALETRAALRLSVEDAAGARADIEAVRADPTATPETLQRVDELAAALPAGGGAEEDAEEAVDG